MIQRYISASGGNPNQMEAAGAHATSGSAAGIASIVRRALENRIGGED
jgi:hypothetical protein